MEAPQGQDENFENLPLEEKLEHKSWKARKSAYEQVKKMWQTAFDSTEECFSEWGPYLKKAIADSNQAAQGEAFEALFVFVDRAEVAPRYTGQLVPIVIEKGFGARASTKEKAEKIVLMFIEREDVASVMGLGHKLAKIVQPCVCLIRQALHDFGPKVVPVKTVIKEIVARGVFSHADGSVRMEGAALLVELYKQYGPNMKALLGVDALRPAQMKELEDAMAASPWTGIPKPERLLRSQQGRIEPVAAEPTAEAAESQAPADAVHADGYDDMEPVEFNGRINEETFAMLESAKWKDRGDALDKISALMAPKMVGRDIDELVRALRKIVASDANVLVVSKAVKILGQLAKGCRRGMNAQSVLPVLLDKLKEKKQSVSDAIHETLDAMYGLCFLLPDIQAELDEAMKNKLAKVRADTVSWLCRMIPRPGYKASLVPMIKPLMAWFIAALDDQAPEVRDACAKAIGVLAGTIGERPLTPWLSQLDNVRQQKVREFIPEGAMQIVMPTLPKPPAKSVPAAPAGGKAPPKSSASKPRAPPAPAGSKAAPKKPAAAAAPSAPAVASKLPAPKAALPQQMKAAAKPREPEPKPKQPPAPAAKPAPKAAAPAPSTKPAPAAAPAPTAKATSAAAGTVKPALKRTNSGEQPRAAAPAAAPALAQAPPMPTTPAGWICLLESSSDEASVVGALQNITAALGTDPDCLSGNLEAAALALTRQLNRVFTSEGELPTRTCKYVLNTHMELWKRPALAMQLNRETLVLVTDEVITRLVDPRVAAQEEFLRALNAVMLKLLEHADPTTSFVALLNLLGRPQSSAKYHELIMKCLLKLSKALSSLLQRLDLKLVVTEMDNFLTAYVARQANPAAGAETMAVKTIRTILHELVKLLGNDILSYLSWTPTPTLLRQYTEQMLKQPTAGHHTASAAVAPSVPVENIDPNAGSSELANGFMERLKNLRERYNLKRDDDPAAGVAVPGAAGTAGETGTCVSADELRLRLAATRTRSFAPLAAADTTISNAAPAPAVTATSAPSVTPALSDLQERLARLKKGVNA